MEKVTGRLCDRRISAQVKGKDYRSVVRPATMHGEEGASDKTRGSRVKNVMIYV